MGDVLLRTLELAGMYAALAAPIIVLALVTPSLRALRDDPAAREAARGLAASAARWGAGAAALASLAVLVQMPSRVADIEETTVLAGIDPALVARFVSGTVTGRLGLLETLGPPRPGYGAQRTYAPQEVAVARFLALVAPWLGPGSRLSRARVQMMCEQIREGDRGTPQLVPGVTVDLDLVCGGTTPS